MNKQTEAMKLALEALQSSQQYVEACANAKTKAGWGEQLDVAEDAIAALREALAEQPRGEGTLAREPLTKEQRIEVALKSSTVGGLIDAVEAAHGIKGDA